MTDLATARRPVRNVRSEQSKAKAALASRYLGEKPAAVSARRSAAEEPAPVGPAALTTQPVSRELKATSETADQRAESGMERKLVKQELRVPVWDFAQVVLRSLQLTSSKSRLRVCESRMVAFAVSGPESRDIQQRFAAVQLKAEVHPIERDAEFGVSLDEQPYVRSVAVWDGRAHYVLQVAF